jgi:hypothetical protein
MWSCCFAADIIFVNPRSGAPEEGGATVFTDAPFLIKTTFHEEAKRLDKVRSDIRRPSVSIVFEQRFQVR